MELIIINEAYLENKKKPVGQRSVYAGSNGVSISIGTRDFLQIRPGDKVNFAMEAKNNKKIYIFKAKPGDDAAFEAKPVKKGAMIHRKELSAKLSSPFKMNKLRFLVSSSPEKIGEHECYQMVPMEITDTAANKNKNTRKNEKYKL
jgi:hypothetical protein